MNYLLKKYILSSLRSSILSEVNHRHNLNRSYYSGNEDLDIIFLHHLHNGAKNLQKIIIVGNIN